MMVGCGPDYKSQVEQLQSERDSLLTEFSMRDSTINGYMKDVGDIQAEIENLVRQEGILNEQVVGNELTKNQKEKIFQDLQSLKSLIESGKNKLASLQSKINKSQRRIEQLDKMIASLSEQLASRDSNIQSLASQIGLLNGKIAELDTNLSIVKSDNAKLGTEISEKTKKLNTAYYVVGDYKKLKTQNVLSQEGKFLGMVKNKSVNSNFSQDAFTRIDVTDTKIIDVYSIKAELLSTHPTGSYELIKQNDKIIAIEILDSDKFWQASKYLVVMTN